MEKEPKKPKEKKLSIVMIECIKSMERYKLLVRWKGGFWTREGCPVKQIFDEIPVPEWSYNWGTIKALIARGIFIVTEENQNQYTFEKYPVAVKMK